MTTHPDEHSPTYWIIPQGAKAEKSWAFDDAEGGYPDWSGWSARCQIRDAGQLLATLRTVGMTGSSDGTITLATDGTVTATLAHTFTKGMGVTSSAVFDLEFINAAGEVTRPISGRVKITGEVTTDD